jgi:pimeloyl-ACP methyl ester carboxylesterase
VSDHGAPDYEVELPDGRVLAVDDRGPSDGPVVLLLHSAPGSRLLDPDPEATASAGVRLVSFDRPGYGASSPLPDSTVPTVVSAAEDAATVLDELGIEHAAVVGWSAGGLVGLGLAARHPRLVRGLAMVCTPAHEDDVARLSQEHKAMVAALRPDLPAAAQAVAEALAAIADSPAAMLDLLAGGAVDDAIRDDPEHGPRLDAMATEAVRQGVAGVAADIVASSIAPWGFDPAEVAAPVHLWYGDDDALVTPAHGAYWAGVLAEAEMHHVPGAGHLLPLVVWRRILAATV